MSNLNKGSNFLLNSYRNNDVNLEVKDDGNLLLENSIYYKQLKERRGKNIFFLKIYNWK
jgi:hypothetical protein